MNKLWILILLYCSAFVAMQAPEPEYNFNATNILIELLYKDVRQMSSAQIKEIIEQIKTLITKGANPNVRPVSFYTPLIFAIDFYDQDPTLIKLLLVRGANPEWINFGPPRISPFSFALQKGNMEVVGLLLDKMDLNVVYPDHETRLTQAIRNRENLVPLLLQRGIDFKTRRRLQVGPPAVPQITNLEIDPLGLAILLNKTNAAKALIEAGADVNQLYAGNRTLLMWAVARNNIEIVKSLMDNGAWKSLNTRNTQGKTAWDIAHEKGYTEVKKLLKTPKIP